MASDAAVRLLSEAGRKKGGAAPEVLDDRHLLRNDPLRLW